MKFLNGLLLTAAAISGVLILAAVYLRIWDVTFIPVGKIAATAGVTALWALIGAIIING